MEIDLYKTKNGHTIHCVLVDNCAGTKIIYAQNRLVKTSYYLGEGHVETILAEYIVCPEWDKLLSGHYDNDDHKGDDFPAILDDEISL